MKCLPSVLQLLTLLLCLGLITCGTEGAAIELLLEISAGSDPFAGVVSVRVEATGPEMSPIRQEAAYHSGAELTLPKIPLGADRVIKVEGLDGAGAVLAFGQSSPFTITDEEPRQLTILFQRCTTRFFLDADKDGFGSPDQDKVICSPVAGYVDNSDDCDDGAPDVRPSQSKFFDAAGGPESGFDYNCDGKEEAEVTALVDCALAGPACKGEGWVGQVPACGQSGSYIVCEKDSSVCGPGPTQTLKQTCR